MSKYINHKYWIYNNDNYVKFLKDNNTLINNSVGGYPPTELYPPVNKGNGKAKTQHLVIMPDMFN